ncbi:hypothetical protein TUM19329_15260 [Legionella antarctica]|uniref:HPt domain-containing protein n=1 Tax=Legionella antarctica TaxID=2708020 RepID=A0A6F8T3B1_9GAMM|nr:Hpt domain-containing protein [Legionella antarctica]BCA95165.1 hypothetical protein TUM19329_15260 [Legionella antarctica]
MNDVFTKPANLQLIHTLIETYFSNPSLPKNETVEKAPTSLGTDLPPTEAELFQLEQFALLDWEEGIKNCGGNESLLKEMLTLMISQELLSDLEQMKLAFSKQEFTTIEKIAHKIKGGCVYLGLTRIKYACQYVERYWKTGERKLFNQLYHQAVKTIEESCTYINDWLSKQ